MPTDRFSSPVDEIPGYETDMSAVGTNRVVDPDAVDDTPWHEVHPELAAELGELPPDPDGVGP
jgi:hypothetical protein